jgi:aryl-alcohol dehydrogenase-like predicted oxidoreductase/enamine deaminase RidA (YjgF/YER057c/UK114 family)
MNYSVERWDIAPDLSISRVLTGLWQIADIERDGTRLDLDATAGEMKPYVEAGFTTFDMADHYGSAEKIAGLFLKQSGVGTAELFTKWVPKPGPSSREQVRAAVQLSLDRMLADRLDLLQFHTWNYADPSYLDTLSYLQELKDEGLIRHLGVTNTDTAHLRIMLNSGFEIVSNQVCFSLLDQRARNNGMTELCQQHGVTLLAFGTVAGGFLTERWLDLPEPDWDQLETWSEMKYGRFIREAGGWVALQDLLHVVNQVAQRHQVSMANIACRYILDQPAVGGVIIGARLGVSENREDNLRLFQFELDASSRSDLDAAVARLRAIPGDCGDEYRRPPFLTASGDLSHHIDTLPPPFEVRRTENGRQRVLSGTVWEDLAGFSRAVRRGHRVVISGTTATHGDRAIGGSDPTSQAHFIIDKIEGALQSLGGSLQDVVQTRVYIQEMEHWDQVARVHGERFREIWPANTLVQAGIIGSEYLVEIEAEAVVEPRAAQHGIGGPEL